MRPLPPPRSNLSSEGPARVVSSSARGRRHCWLGLASHVCQQLPSLSAPPRLWQRQGPRTEHRGGLVSAPGLCWGAPPKTLPPPKSRGRSLRRPRLPSSSWHQISPGLCRGEGQSPVASCRSTTVWPEWEESSLDRRSELLGQDKPPPGKGLSPCYPGLKGGGVSEPPCREPRGSQEYTRGHARPTSSWTGLTGPLGLDPVASI